MAAHVIRMPDYESGWEPREFVWDPDAGTVGGDHSSVGDLRDLMDGIVADGGEYRQVGGRWRLRDPWRDPADFLRALWLIIGNVSWDPKRLPPALRGVEPTPFEADELPPGAIA